MQTKGYEQELLLFYFILYFPRGWRCGGRARAGGRKVVLLCVGGNWEREKERKERADGDGDGVLTDGSQKLEGDGDCLLLTGKGFGLHGLTGVVMSWHSTEKWAACLLVTTQQRARERGRGRRKRGIRGIHTHIHAQPFISRVFVTVIVSYRIVLYCIVVSIWRSNYPRLQSPEWGIPVIFFLIFA